MANEKRLIDANAFQFEPDPWGGANGVLIWGRNGGKTNVYSAVSGLLFAMGCGGIRKRILLQRGGQSMKLIKAINMLMEEYEKAAKQERIHDPVAYALYQVWKKADEEGNDGR